MLRFVLRTLVALAIAGAGGTAAAFALLGPLDPLYQVAGLGYNPLNTDIGGPMNLGQEYRWNVRTITYAIDPSFARYFGDRGMQEVRKAVAVLNALPPMSKLSEDLTEFPLNTRRINFQAMALGTMDLKSTCLATLLEEMGLASPERYVFTLRSRLTVEGITFYTVIMRNFDPVTWTQSRYVNGTLYTYAIVDPTPTTPTFADAVEIPVDPQDQGFSAVVSAADGFWGGGLVSGQFFTGLSRDDVGALRYIYRKNNYLMEGLSPGMTNVISTGGSPWAAIGGSNTMVDIALRPGIDKIQFKELKFDSVFGGWPVISNIVKDVYVTNNHTYTQRIERSLEQPDILFAAGMLPVDAGGNVVAWSRTVAADPVWRNNAATNSMGGDGAQAGPGQIQRMIVITFDTTGPWIMNARGENIEFMDEVNQWNFGFIWASFDGTANAPFIYPNGGDIQDLERRVTGGD